jgi:hypothetical protein
MKQKSPAPDFYHLQRSVSTLFYYDHNKNPTPLIDKQYNGVILVIGVIEVRLSKIELHRTLKIL